MGIFLKKQIFLYVSIIIATLLLSDSKNPDTTINQRLIFTLILLVINYKRGIDLNLLDVTVIAFFSIAIIANILFKSSSFFTLNTLSPISFSFLYINLKELFSREDKENRISILLHGTFFTVILLNILYLLLYNKAVLNNPIPFTNTTLTSNFLSITASCLISINPRTSYILIYPILYTLINKARIAIVVFTILTLSKFGIKNYVKIFLISGLVILFSFIKSDSSSGRLLIAKTSLAHIETVIITPIGFGEFANWYLPHQSEYLNRIEKFNSDFLLADNTEFAFNDFFQVFIELGLIGLGMYIAIFILTLKYIKHFKPKYNFTNFLCYYLFLSFFSYSLYVDLFKFILLAVIAYVSTHQSKSILHISRNNLFLLKCILIPLIIFNLYWHFNPDYRLEGKSSFLIINPEHKIYDEAYRLFINHNYSEALYLLDKIQPANIDMDLLLLKAKCNEETFNIANAYKYYIQAYQILPNKFKPKHHLFKFLINHNLDASTIAKDIIETPIKVHNRETQKLKKEAEDYLIRQ